MNYLETIKSLIAKIPTTLVDMNEPREKSRVPSLASSEFLTNREQGDWAEKLVLEAINSIDNGIIAVHYGKSDNKVAGEVGFEKFYQEYQDELDTIGKRPDILVLNKSDYKPEWNFDISKLSEIELSKIVPQAIAGIEIRSSSFLIDKYDDAIQKKQNEYKKIAIESKDIILNQYADLLSSEWIDLLINIHEANLNIISFRVPSKKSSQRLVELTNYFKTLKDALKQIQKRDFLSITPKVEDIKVVYKWIETYQIPHFYFQVFFDKVYGISFQQILELISDSNNEGQTFFVESGDAKNQNKNTIKINPKVGVEIAHKVTIPNHYSQMRELDRGRLLFHVSFEGGKATLNLANLYKTLNISN